MGRTCSRRLRWRRNDQPAEMTPAKRDTRRTLANATQPQLPLWLILAGGIGTVIAGFVGARGPESVIKELKEVAGVVEPPKIVSLQPTRNDESVFIVSIENPSLRQIQITAYTADPVGFASMTNASTGALPLVDADEEPAECIAGRRVALARPLVIDAGTAGGLTVRPWNEKCDFRLSVEGTSGASKKASWTPDLNRLLCSAPGELQMPRDPKADHE